MKKVGILGGTFNPPHIGHLIIANEIKHALKLDEVRLQPTAISPHKETIEKVTAEQRFRMVELAVEDVEGLSASSFEVNRGGTSFTYDTMEALTALEPNSEFYFIIGGDMIDILPTWYRIEDLLKIVTLVGVNRPGAKGKTDYRITLVDIPEIDLSSTLIRERFYTGETVTFLVPNAVESFIREEGLYGARQVDR